MKNEKLKIAIVGSSGKMGKTLIEAINQSSDCQLTVALDLPRSPNLGKIIETKDENIIISSEVDDLKKADFLIDFTRPAGTLKHLEICSKFNIKVVTGTTGFSDEEKLKIQEFSKIIPIVYSPNMSIGVNVTFKLLELASKTLSDYDVEIIETHHKHKVDAPSGTALKMGEIIAKAQSTDLKERAIYERFENIGERKNGTIGFSSVRAGDIIGEHKVLFANNGERIEIIHKSSSRDNYAQGSLTAVRFLANQTTGLFDMFDVLNLY